MNFKQVNKLVLQLDKYLQKYDKILESFNDFDKLVAYYPDAKVLYKKNSNKEYLKKVSEVLLIREKIVRDKLFYLFDAFFIFCERSSQKFAYAYHHPEDKKGFKIIKEFDITNH